MADNVSLRQLLDEGIALEAHEAVAIAQQVIRAAARVDGVSDSPVSADGVSVAANGSVQTALTIAPEVNDIARLLDAMLPQDGTVRVPGALRYAIARGLGIVDAPPFESLAAFSASLDRFERGDRDRIVAGLLRRRAPAERRRPTITYTDLRHQLREADQLLFETRLKQRDGRGWRLARYAAALLLSFTTGYTAVGIRQHLTSSTPAGVGPRRDAVSTTPSTPLTTPSARRP